MFWNSLNSVVFSSYCAARDSVWEKSPQIVTVAAGWRFKCKITGAWHPCFYIGMHPEHIQLATSWGWEPPPLQKDAFWMSRVHWQELSQIDCAGKVPAYKLDSNYLRHKCVGVTAESQSHGCLPPTSQAVQPPHRPKQSARGSDCTLSLEAADRS